MGCHRCLRTFTPQLRSFLAATLYSFLCHAMRHLHVYYLAWLLGAGPDLQTGHWPYKVVVLDGMVVVVGGGGVWWDGFGPGQVAATSQSLSVTFVIVVCCLLHTVGKMGKIWCGAGGLGHGYVNKKPNSKLAVEASPRITKGGEERAKNRSASSEFRIPLHLARIWTDKRNLFYIRNFKKQASISKSN